MSKKSKIMENSLSMPDILKEFHTYKTGRRKAAYLREMGQLNLPHAINWENLAKTWEGSKPWPRKKDEQDESIMKDYLDPVGETNAEKSLTKQELDAIL